MTLVILVILLMISLLIVAIPFLKTCKERGMGFAIRKFFIVWMLIFWLLIMIASGLLIKEIIVVQRQMSNRINDCNQMVEEWKER